MRHFDNNRGIDCHNQDSVLGRLSLAWVVALLFSCAVFAKAQSGNSDGARLWRWHDAVSALESSNPYLASSEYSRDKSRHELKKSYSAFLPSLTASASGARRRSTPTSGSVVLDDDSYSLGLSAKLSLFSGFSDINSVRLRRNEVNLSELDFARAKSDALYKLKNAFVELLWSQEQVGLAAEITDRRRKNRDLVRLKYEGGREDKGSLLRVEADLLRAEYEERKARRQMFAASNNFLRAIGLEPNSGQELSARIADKFNDILSSSAILSIGVGDSRQFLPPDFVSLASKTPEVIGAVIRLESARFSVGISRSAFWPDLSLGASLSRSGDSLSPLGDESSSVSMNLSWRIFEGGKDYFSLMASREQEKIQGENLRAVKLSVASALENGWRNMVDAYENLDVSQKYVEAAGSQSEIVAAKYLNGLASYQEWYSVENDYISARKNLLNAMKDAILSEALWKNILGVAP